MDADSDLLLTLYRAAQSRSASEFQQFAIELVEPRIGFGAAVWAHGYRTGTAEHPGLVPIMALSHTHRTDPAGVAQWRAINRADKAIPLLLGSSFSTLHIHTPTLFAAHEDADMRDYARRFGRQNALVTNLSAPRAPIVEWSVLYRAKADDQFSATERARCQHLVLHLSEAMRVNRIVQRAQGSSSGLDDPHGGAAALVTRSGEVLAGGDEFIVACREEWREFDGHQLPFSAMRQLIESSSIQFRGRVLRLRGRPIADLWWLTATTASGSASDRLPPRRMNVADLFAAGHSHKSIAQSLGISPATVRNHVAASYRELNVTNRVELKAMLDRG